MLKKIKPIRIQKNRCLVYDISIMGRAYIPFIVVVTVFSMSCYYAALSYKDWELLNARFSSSSILMPPVRHRDGYDWLKSISKAV